MAAGDQHGVGADFECLDIRLKSIRPVQGSRMMRTLGGYSRRVVPARSAPR